MHGFTHERMARMLFPELNQAPPGMIQSINHSMDNPAPWMRAFQAVQDAYLGGSSPEFPLLQRKGHRKYGHDLFTALMLGYFQGGPNGVKAAYNHLMGDAMSDLLVQSMGTEGRDLWEAMFMYVTSPHKSRRRQFAFW